MMFYSVLKYKLLALVVHQVYREQLKKQKTVGTKIIHHF